MNTNCQYIFAMVKFNLLLYRLVRFLCKVEDISKTSLFNILFCVTESTRKELKMTTKFCFNQF